MDNFKKYIQDNKSQLDGERPSPNLWDRIEQDIELPKEEKKVVPRTRWVAAAACLLVILVSGYIFLEKNKTQVQIPTFVQNHTPITKDSNDYINKVPTTITNMPPKIETQTFAAAKQKEKTTETRRKVNKIKHSARYVIEDVEVGNFSQVINYQRQYISTLPIYGQKPGYFSDFKQQLQQMDSDEKSVRNDIKKHGLNPKQIELLINIYQQKINLLKQLNQEIDRVNKSFYQNHSQKDSTKMDNPHFLNL